MVITGQEILERKIFSPAVPRTYHEATGLTYGASVGGYDVRIKQSLTLLPGEFALASTYEYFDVPNDLIGFLHDKSTLARMGLFVGVGVIESGWKGFLTIEMKNQQNHPLTVFAGQPIAQVVFHLVVNPTGGYSGRYQDQPDEAVRAKITEGYANVNDPQHITAASCGRIG